MKKLVCLSASLILLVSCSNKKPEEAAPHWSHEACVEYIVNEKKLSNYVYEVVELDHDYIHGDDEIHCFKIAIKSGNYEKKWMCYAVLDDGEVLFVDCDPIWTE